MVLRAGQCRRLNIMFMLLALAGCAAAPTRRIYTGASVEPALSERVTRVKLKDGTQLHVDARGAASSPWSRTEGTVFLRGDSLHVIVGQEWRAIAVNQIEEIETVSARLSEGAGSLIVVVGLGGLLLSIVIISAFATGYP